MAEILARRQTLHRSLEHVVNQNRQLRSEMAQMQALANLGLVSAMIAHEMNNILTPLGSYAQLAINNPADKALRDKVLGKTVLNSSRAGRILESMLAMANGRGCEKQFCNLKELTDEVFACMGRNFGKDKIRVIIEIDSDTEVWAEAVAIEQVLMNLILNAREAMSAGAGGRGGVLTISAGKDDDSSVWLTVSDTGCGIATENLVRVFEPFFTTKTGDGKSQSKRHGAGLGLAFCKRVVEDHDGAIRVESEPGKGTAFRIRLPRCAQSKTVSGTPGQAV